VTGVTTEQTGLSTYAEAVLRQNGIKSCRVRWPAPEVLSIEVDPTRRAQALRLLPIIQQRAGTGIDVQLLEPSAPSESVPVVVDPFRD
jgi:hypothetical protein